MKIFTYQIFLTACQCGSMTKTAEQLNITQPSVSAAIRSLEYYFKVSLFTRKNRRIYLTREGRELQGFAEKIVSEHHKAEIALGKIARKKAVWFGVNTSIGEGYLQTILGALNRKMPDVELHSVSHANSRVIELLGKLNLDFIIVDAFPETPEIVQVPVFSERMLAVCAHDCPLPERLTLRQLSESNLFLKEPFSGSRQCAERVFQQHGCKINIASSSESTATIVDSVSTGMGNAIALLPESIVQPFITRGKLREIRIIDAAFIRRFSAAYLKIRENDKLILSAVDVLKDFNGILPYPNE